MQNNAHQQVKMTFPGTTWVQLCTILVQFFSLFPARFCVAIPSSGDAEAVEALVCKTSLSGFESRRYLHFLFASTVLRSV
jgi:hypothetical protein